MPEPNSARHPAVSVIIPCFKQAQYLGEAVDSVVDQTFTIEDEHANLRSDNFFSVAYWYQTEPHKKFDPLPPVEKRMPNVHWKIDVLEKGLPD